MVARGSLTKSSSSGLLRFLVLLGFVDEEEGSVAEPARTIGVGFVVGVAGSTLGGTGDVDVDVDMGTGTVWLCGIRSVVVVGTFGRCG